MLIDQLRWEYCNRFAVKQAYVWTLKFDPNQPREPKGSSTGGQFTSKTVAAAVAMFKVKYPVVAKQYPRSTYTERGSIESHTKDVGREWALQLPPDEMKAISERFGSDVDRVMTAAIALHDIGKAEAIEEGGGKEVQHEHTIPILQEVLRKEGFNEKSITLATELINHDLIGPLFRGYEGFKATEADVVTKLKAKAEKVGMDVSDFVTLQLAFYQADASAYPYITQYMTQEPSGRWTFKGSPKIAGIEALITRARKRELFLQAQIYPVQSIARKFAQVLKFDPNQPRDEQGQWAKTSGRIFTSEEGYQWHEKGPVAEWAKQLPYADTQAINSYAGFGYHDVNDLRRGTYKVPIKAHFVRAATEEEYEASRFTVTEEYIKQHGHPFGKRPYERKPEDPFERVLDAEGNYVGHIESNIYYKDPAGNPVRFSVQRAGPDLEQLAEVQRQADALDDLIANRGYALPEAIVVERGAYLPGVTFEQLQDMQYEGPHGEPPAIWEEKGFTSTMVGDAEGRAKSYPALGKWESISHRFGSGSGVLVKHQDEVGSAVQFHITIPAGTKVAPVEGVRRLRHEFPRIPNPEPMGPKELADPFWQKHPELWQVTDYTQTPTVDAKDLEGGKEGGRRTESELLIGSGGRFRVTKTHHGQTYRSGDPTLKSVPIVEVYLEYIGGGSSDPRRGH